MAGFNPVGSSPVGSLPSGSVTVSGSLRSMWLRESFSTTFTAVGGTGPYTWTATGLPTGLSINSSTGVVSGTPTATGSFSGTVTATDTLSVAGNTAVSAYVSLNNGLTVQPNPTRLKPPHKTGFMATANRALVLNNDYLTISRKAIDPNPKSPPKKMNYGFVAGRNISQVSNNDYLNIQRKAITPNTPRKRTEMGVTQSFNLSYWSGIQNYLSVSKMLGYAVLSPPSTALSIAKLVGYAVITPPQAALSVAKLLGYAVLRTENNQFGTLRNQELPRRPSLRNKGFTQQALALSLSPTIVRRPVVFVTA